MGQVRHLESDAIHTYFDNSLAPSLTIDSGDEVVFQTREASFGQRARSFVAKRDSAVPNDLAELITASVRPETEAMPRGHPLSGPVFVRDAQAGDALAITVLEIEVGSWGWTTTRPRGGFLDDDAIERVVHYWDLRNRDHAWFTPHIRVPLQPFCGIMATAPKTPGIINTVTPSNFGGNMDVRQMTVGSTVYLPVNVAGALFSVGDVHAVQGDGEISGTGLECDATVTLRFNLLRGASISTPTFRTCAPIMPRTDTASWFAVTGHNPDLYEALRVAVGGVLDFLVRERGLSRSSACILASICVQLHLSQVVNNETKTVTAFLPMSIFHE